MADGGGDPAAMRRHRVRDGMLMVVLVAVCWALWIASTRYVFVSVDIHRRPYGVGELVGCAACIAVVIVVAFARLPARVVFLGVPLTLIASCSASGLPPGNVAMDAWAGGAFGVIVISFAFALVGVALLHLGSVVHRRHREEGSPSREQDGRGA